MDGSSLSSPPAIGWRGSHEEGAGTSPASSGGITVRDTWTVDIRDYLAAPVASGARRLVRRFERTQLRRAQEAIADVGSGLILTP